MPDLHREEHRINNRRDRCSFRKTQKLIAKMMSSTNKSDLRWVPYFFGQIHLARAMALVDLGRFSSSSPSSTRRSAASAIRSARCRIRPRPSPS